MCLSMASLFPSALQLLMSLSLTQCLSPSLEHLCLLSPAESVPLGSFSRPRSPGPQPGISASLSVSIFCLCIFLHPYLCLSLSSSLSPPPLCDARCVSPELSHSAIFLSASACLCTHLGIPVPPVQLSGMLLSLSSPPVSDPGPLSPAPWMFPSLSLRGPSKSWETASLRALIDKLWVPASLLWTGWTGGGHSQVSGGQSGSWLGFGVHKSKKPPAWLDWMR